MPISATLADDEVMLTIKPNQHGSTFGGNPLAARVCREALDVITDENLTSNSHLLGLILLENLKQLNRDIIREVRGKGLMTALEIDEKVKGWDFCLKLAENGLLAK